MVGLVMHSWTPGALTGAVINMLEYFFAIYEHNKEFKFVIIDQKSGDHRQFYFDVAYDRYYLDDLKGFEENFIYLKRSSLIRNKFEKVLVHDSLSVKEVKGVIRADEIIVLADFYLDNPKYFLGKDKYNVEYFGEMPFQYKDTQYNFKMLFDRFKKLPHEDNAIYIHSPRNQDKSFVDKLNLPKNKPVIHRGFGHLDGLFSRFNEFIYYHAHTWFDMTPRLMHECTFYGKPVRYINEWNLKDGSYFRYKDLQENGLKNRTLSKNDEIVRRFI
jgi:hypothetical protein